MYEQNDEDIDVINLDDRVSHKSMVSNDSFISFTLEAQDCEIQPSRQVKDKLSLDFYGSNEAKANHKFSNLRINENFEIDKVLDSNYNAQSNHLQENNSNRSNEKVFRINKSGINNNEETRSKQISLIKIQKNLNAQAESKIMINAKRPSFFNTGCSPIGMNQSFAPFTTNNSYVDFHTKRQVFKIKDLKGELSFNGTTVNNPRVDSAIKNPIKKNANYDLIATKTMPQQYDNEHTIYKNSSNIGTSNYNKFSNLKPKDSKTSRNQLLEDDAKNNSTIEPFLISPKDKGSLNQSIQEKLKIIYSKASIDKGLYSENQNLFGTKKSNYPKHRLESHREKTVSRSKVNITDDSSKNNINQSREVYQDLNKCQGIPGRTVKISSSMSRSRNIEHEQMHREPKMNQLGQSNFIRNYFRNNNKMEGTVYTSFINNNSKQSIGNRENSSKNNLDEVSSAQKNKFFIDKQSNTNNYHITNQVPNKYSIKLKNLNENKNIVDGLKDKSLSILECNKVYLKDSEKHTKKINSSRGPLLNKKTFNHETKSREQSINNVNNLINTGKPIKHLLYQSQESDKGYLKNQVKKVSTNIYMDLAGKDGNNNKFKLKKKQSGDSGFCLNQSKPYVNLTNRQRQNELSQKSRRHINSENIV